MVEAGLPGKNFLLRDMIPNQKTLNLAGYQNRFLIAGQIFRDGFFDNSGASIYYAI
jgi:hypothetical protein